MLSFFSEHCISTYFIDSWNPIDTEVAQESFMAIYDARYDNMQRLNALLRETILALAIG